MTAAVLAEARELVDAGRALDAIDVLTTADRREPDAEVAAEAIRLRHEAFDELRELPAAPTEPLRAGEWPGPDLPDDLGERLQKLGPAGVIYFARNLDTPERLPASVRLEARARLALRGPREFGEVTT